MAECGLTNLAVCLPEKFFEFLLSIFNAPLEPLLALTKGLLTEPVNIAVFSTLWLILVYVISLFYGLFFIFAGFNFMISGYNAQKRENAKSWLRNVIFMIFFVQSSYFIYELVIEMGALMTTGVIDLIDPEFFLLQADNIGSLGLELTLLIPYISILLVTVIVLGLRYLMVSIGVVLLPFGLFFYFIPPLKTYGKMILNILFTLIFITFFDAVLLFGASALVGAVVFQDLNIVVTIVAFFAIDILMIFMMFFVMVKSAFSVMDSDVGRNISRGVKYLV